MQYHAVRITPHNRRIVELLRPSLDFYENQHNWLIIPVEDTSETLIMTDGGFKSRFGQELNYSTINIHIVHS